MKQKKVLSFNTFLISSKFNKNVTLKVNKKKKKYKNKLRNLKKHLLNTKQLTHMDFFLFYHQAHILKCLKSFRSFHIKKPFQMYFSL